ncbi:MAG: stage III sporulation protein AB [Oscillospiraceae bacterium]|nr:stage III sporulation protein AB [Oscillospiraceae bacterium]
MKAMENACRLLSGEHASALRAYGDDGAEEIRLRIGRRPSVLIDGWERTFSKTPVTETDLLRLLEVATGASLHTAAPALADGYLSYRGLRIGLCGTVVVQESKVCTFRSFTSAAIRLPAEHRGICDALADEILSSGLGSTLVLSPPGGGKTTALRELIRRFSDAGLRVCVVDERNELAAVDGAVPQFDLGSRCDVLTGVDKASGTTMLLRAMNPQIIAMDEIGRRDDLAAVEQAAGCGVWLLASVHARDRDELLLREGYRRLLERRVFRYLITIRGSGAARRYSLSREGA